jgi:hypothetical protein
MLWKVIYRILAYISFVVRVAAPLFVFFAPIFVAMTVFITDWIDVVFYKALGFNRLKYDLIDKSLDLWWYSISLIYAYFNLPLFQILLALFLWRLFGQIIFFTKKEDWVLIFTPNIYEDLFLILLFMKFYPGFERMVADIGFVQVILAVSLFQVFREVFVHYLDRKLNKRTRKYLPEWIHTL